MKRGETETQRQLVTRDELWVITELMGEPCYLPADKGDVTQHSAAHDAISANTEKGSVLGMQMSF